MNTDTHMSGSTVNNHISLKIGIRTQCNTENFVPIVDDTFEVRKLTIQITIQQSCQVKERIDQYRETRSLLKHQQSCYMNQPKSPNQIEVIITNRFGETRIPTYQIGCKNSERILWMKEFLNTETNTRVLLMNL